MIISRNILVIGGLSLMVLWLVASDNRGLKHARPNTRRLQEETEEEPKSAEDAYVETLRLPEDAKLWCEEPRLPPLNYRGCDQGQTVYNIVYRPEGGLKMVLLSVLKAMQEDRCFYVSAENEVDLIILLRFMDEIGLPQDHPIIRRARGQGRIYTLEWWTVWAVPHYRRFRGSTHSIVSAGYLNADGNFLKKIALKRMFRLKPSLRLETCNRMDKFDLREEYLAINAENYVHHSKTFIVVAEEMIREHFPAGANPKIFVVAQDCSIMYHFRSLKPQWNFISECDTDPFPLAGGDPKYNVDLAAKAFQKKVFDYFILASAKFVVGARHSNMAWWAFMMRRDNWSMHLLDSSWIKGDSIATW